MIHELFLDWHVRIFRWRVLGVLCISVSLYLFIFTCLFLYTIPQLRAFGRFLRAHVLFRECEISWRE